MANVKNKLSFGDVQVYSLPKAIVDSSIDFSKLDVRKILLQITCAHRLIMTTRIMSLEYGYLLITIRKVSVM